MAEDEQLFQLGDVVILKSGGPRMTINDDKLGFAFDGPRYFSGNYECIWFEGTKLISGKFTQNSLEKA